MDSSGLQRSTSVPSNLQSKKEVSEKIQSKRSKFFATYQHQNFSLPDSVMFYMVTNPPSDDIYQKLIQTCKYFFVKNPILVTTEFAYYEDKWKLFRGRRRSDLSKIIAKLWITDKLFVNSGNSVNKKAVNPISSIMPKLYQCDARCVSIKNLIICFHDLFLLISSAETIIFYNLTVQNKDGSIVLLEKIFEAAVNAKTILFFSDTNLPNVTSNTMKALIKLPHFSKLDRLILNRIPETFDLEAFYGYMKKNKTTKFVLCFNDSISEVYKNRIEKIVDEILATKTFDFKPPHISFVGLDEEKYRKIVNVYYSH